jgi:hypothetical protein
MMGIDFRAGFVYDIPFRRKMVPGPVQIIQTGVKPIHLTENWYEGRDG